MPLRTTEDRYNKIGK